MATANKKKASSLGTRLSNKSIEKVGVSFFVDGGFDIIFMILVFALLTIGLIMMFSASYVYATYSSETDGDSFHYIKRQLAFAIVGVGIMFFVSKVNPQFIKKFVAVIFAISIILLVAVLFFHTDVENSPDIKRWMPLPIGSFQPSDVAKLGLIMTLAYAIEKYKRELEKKWWLPIILVGIVAFFSFLVYLESHLSGTILMFGIGILMIFLGGIDRRWFIVGAVALVLIVLVAYVFRENIFNDYQLERFASFFNKDYTDKDTRWQTNQSLFALGSGGVFGLGLGNSHQKFLYLPEPQNDFVFAIVGEELGFIRCVIILMIYAALVTRGFIIAARAKSAYERLLVLGICLQVGIQTVLNILVVTDMMPNTGISLPFFSYGGTALIILLAEMGLVLGVSRNGERFPKKVNNKIEGENNA